MRIVTLFKQATSVTSATEAPSECRAYVTCMHKAEVTIAQACVGRPATLQVLSGDVGAEHTDSPCTSHQTLATLPHTFRDPGYDQDGTLPQWRILTAYALPQDVSIAATSFTYAYHLSSR